ncbi:MAG: phosphotransferase [Firmicutes bacterium]|nr:phosphotransferase [Bacillota bacterium]
MKTDRDRLFDSFKEKHIIDYGWSGDEKYRAVDADGLSYLLRRSPLKREAKFRTMMELMSPEAFPCDSVSHLLAVRADGKKVETLWDWIEGGSAELALPAMSSEQQAELGRQAGRVLRQLHSISAPEGTAAWDISYNAKIDRKIQEYRDCPLRFDGDRSIIDFIEQNRPALKDRPLSFQHGDYHVGNMIVNDNKLYVIDFDRWSWGDPWEEYNRIVWCAKVSPIFASSMIRAYFEDDIPEQFWTLLAIYLGTNMIGSIPWAIGFGEKEIKTQMDNAKLILEWYDGYTRDIPAWFY